MLQKLLFITFFILMSFGRSESYQRTKGNFDDNGTVGQDTNEYLQEQIDELTFLLKELSSKNEKLENALNDIIANKAEDSNCCGIHVMQSLLEKFDTLLQHSYLKVKLIEEEKALCPYPFEEEGEMCLHFVLKGHTFSKARSNCEAMGNGTRLAIPNTDSKAMSLKNFMVTRKISSPTGWAWLGATESKSVQGNWYWFDGTKVTFGGHLAWNKGEPNGHLKSYPEDCLDINTGTYGVNDDNCAHELSSLCEFPLNIH